MGDLGCASGVQWQRSNPLFAPRAASAAFERSAPGLKERWNGHRRGMAASRHFAGSRLRADIIVHKDSNADVA